MKRSANVSIFNHPKLIISDEMQFDESPTASDAPTMFSPRALRRPSLPSFSMPVDSPIGYTSPFQRLAMMKSPSDEVRRASRNSQQSSGKSRSFSAERHSMAYSSLPQGTFLVTVNSTYGSVPIRCHPWNTISDIKEALSVYLRSLLPDTIRVESLIPWCSDVDSNMIRIFSAGKELYEMSTVQDAKVDVGSCLYATVCALAISPAHVLPEIEAWGEFRTDEICLSLVEACKQGFQANYYPYLASHGTGGTYFLKDKTNRTVAVFKPDDEEPKAPNNPRGYQGRMYQPGLRNGILSGEAAVREVAAYLLDHERFANVPRTTRVEAIHDAFCYNVGPRVPKAGSLQEFVHFDEMSGDLAPQIFDVDQVHRIALLDIRLVNTDRNDANILVKRNPDKSLRLIPVDHGYCLPDFLEIAWCDWCWLDWPQAKVQFSPDMLQYIASLDVKSDVDILRRKLSIREESLRIMEICGRVLQTGAAAGLNLHQIGKIISRDNLDAPSLLEITVEQALSLATSAKKKVKQPSLTRASTMISQCSKCMSWISEGGSDCGCEPNSDKNSSSTSTDRNGGNGGCNSNINSPRSNKFLTEPLDEFFWRYFNVLLNRVIQVKSGKTGFRTGRRNSCLLY
jgi:hypothetical protein